MYYIGIIMEFPRFINRVNYEFVYEVTLICCYKDDYILINDKSNKLFYTPYDSLNLFESYEHCIKRILYYTLGTTQCEYVFISYYQYKKNKTTYFGILYLINTLDLYKYTNPKLSDIHFFTVLPKKDKWLYPNIHFYFFVRSCTFLIIE